MLDEGLKGLSGLDKQDSPAAIAGVTNGMVRG
jgi:hypothetical protein